MAIDRKSLEHSIVSGIAAGLCIFALMANVQVFLNGKYLQLGSILFYLFLAFLFVFRIRPVQTSGRPLHWVFALAGSFSPFLLKPVQEVPPVLNWVGVPLTLAGMSISILALVYLGRSFGVIAARRKIKTGGPYQYIRHPMYLGEAIWFASVVIQNFSAYNLLVLIINLSCQILRIREEELVLCTEAQYVEYCRNVPYKLVPGLF